MVAWETPQCFSKSVPLPRGHGPWYFLIRVLFVEYHAISHHTLLPSLVHPPPSTTLQNNRSDSNVIDLPNNYVKLCVLFYHSIYSLLDNKNGDFFLIEVLKDSETCGLHSVWCPYIGNGKQGELYVSASFGFQNAEAGVF